MGWNARATFVLGKEIRQQPIIIEVPDCYTDAIGKNRFLRECKRRRRPSDGKENYAGGDAAGIHNANRRRPRFRNIRGINDCLEAAAGNEFGDALGAVPLDHRTARKSGTAYRERESVSPRLYARRHQRLVDERHLRQQSRASYDDEATSEPDKALYPSSKFRDG